MKFLLLLFVTNLGAQEAYETKRYTVKESVLGYSCPLGYYFNPPTRLCYPSKTPTVQDKIESTVGRELPQKRLNSDVVTVNIYNNSQGQLSMPVIDVDGKIKLDGVKRKKVLDKQGIHDAIDKAIDGEYFQEEPEAIDELLAED